MANSDRQKNNNESLTPEAIKRAHKELVKTWHPDKASEIGFVTPPDDVIKIINNVFSGMSRENIKNFQFWPSDFNDDTQVQFPALTSGAPARTISIPRTPEDFFTLLRYIKNNHTFPQREFKKVHISKMQGRDSDDRESRGNDRSRSEFDAEFDKYAQSLRDNKSIDDLMLKAQALAVLPPGYAEAHKLNEVIDGQGEYLFNSAFSIAKSPVEFMTLLEKLPTFPFKNADIVHKLLESGAQYVRRFFMEKMKHAASEKGLDRLVLDIYSLYANAALPQTDRDEILEFIERKRSAYAQKWARKEGK